MPFIEIVTHLETTHKKQLVGIGNVCDLSIVAMKGVPVARLNMASGKDLCYGFKELSDAMQFAKELGEKLKEGVNAQVDVDGAKIEENIYPTKEELQADTMRQILDTEKFVRSF